MEVKDKTAKPTKVGGIPAGNCFNCGDGTFMVIDMNGWQVDNFNKAAEVMCVNLKDGTVGLYSRNREVTPITAHVEVD